MHDGCRSKSSGFGFGNGASASANAASGDRNNDVKEATEASIIRWR